MATRLYTGGKPRSRSSMQMKHANQDHDGRVRWACSLCQITYYMHESDKPACPMCALYGEHTEAMRRLASAEQTIRRLENDLHDLEVRIDYVTAFKSASELLSNEDMAFLKSVLYRWRDTKNLNLKTIHGRSGPRGFIAHWKTGETEQHICTSVGGVAMAGLLQEVAQGFGESVALMTMAKAMSTHLKGGL